MIWTAIAGLEVTGARQEPIRVTADFGVAEFPTYATPEALLAAADAALYQAKRGEKTASRRRRCMRTAGPMAPVCRLRPSRVASAGTSELSKTPPKPKQGVKGAQ